LEKISIVIPCYKSEAFIEITVEGIIAELDRLTGYDYEIILVSDASPDGVYTKILDIAKSNNRIIGLEFSRNFGQHLALLAGYREASGDFIVSMDDDGQTPASGIPVLLEKLKEGYDVVFAKYPDLKQSAFRRIGSYFNQKIMDWGLSKPKSVITTSFFIFRKYICDEIKKTSIPHPYIAGLIFRVTQNVGNAEIDQKERISGESGYSLYKLFSLWVNGLTTFSIKPLRIATLAGTIVAIAGFVGMILVFINKAIHPEAPLGYSSTLTIMLFLGGVIMLMLGIIGEYIGRVFISVNNSSQYVIRNRTYEE